MTEMEHLENALQHSFHAHGDIPVKLGHLLNLVRLARFNAYREIESAEEEWDRLQKEIDPLAQES